MKKIIYIPIDQESQGIEQIDLLQPPFHIWWVVSLLLMLLASIF